MDCLRRLAGKLDLVVEYVSILWVNLYICRADGTRGGRKIFILGVQYRGAGDRWLIESGKLNVFGVFNLLFNPLQLLLKLVLLAYGLIQLAQGLLELTLIHQFLQRIHRDELLPLLVIQRESLLSLIRLIFGLLLDALLVLLSGISRAFGGLWCALLLFIPGVLLPHFADLFVIELLHAIHLRLVLVSQL